jgi:hypothetical protein
MGSVEGDQLIAPITGNALFLTKGKVVATMDPGRGKLMNQSHEAYTDADLEHAIRNGMHPSGRAMNELMPRYALKDNELNALIGYLRTLSTDWSPGAEEQVVHLATVITPDVEATRRKLFLDTLRAAISQKNANTMPGKRHMVTAAEFTMKTERQWDLQVWELQGPPDTWPGQLREFYDRQPVFAMVSGLSGGSWAKVHDFCEQQQLPCWFPSVKEIPASASTSFYSLYFSQGVALEAAVIAQQLKHQSKEAAPKRLVQIVGQGPAPAGAATVLERLMKGSAVKLEKRVLSSTSTESLQKVFAGLDKRDAAMIWMSGSELEALKSIAPPTAQLYFSANLGEAERAPLPDEWKSVAHLVYPYELPQKRGSNLAYFRAWINQRNLPLLDEPMQSEVYFSVIYLTETLGEMLNNLYRDYLIERAENMLTRRESRKAEEETRERQAIRERYTHLIASGSTGGSAADAVKDPGRAVITPAENLGRRTGTTIYPVLSLGPGQRFASKGAYIVRFAGDGTRALEAESGWIVP